MNTEKKAEELATTIDDETSPSRMTAEETLDVLENLQDMISVRIDAIKGDLGRR
jgi:hypothetical protein